MNTVFHQSGKPFKILTVSSLSEVRGRVSYEDLFERRLDALIIRNHFSALEVDSIKSCITKIDSNRLARYGGRYTAIPPVFETSKVLENPDYFKKSQVSFNYLCQLCGIDFEHKSKTVFTELTAEGTSTAFPSLLPGEAEFVPACLRIIPPSYGKIRIHADNDFYTGKDHVFRYFKSQVDTSNTISHIAMINSADEGGNLVLHDLEFKDYDKIIDGHTAVHRKTGQTKSINSFRSEEINLNNGDLILFAGGQIWHSVSQMQGEKDRITFGGFSSYSHKRDKVYLWT